MASRVATATVDFTRIYTTLGLGKETISALQAFRKRHNEAQRLQAVYTSQPTTVDFAHYRSVLKNTSIVDECEKRFKDFKPVTYDVNAQLKAIETFEAKALEKANETEAKIDAEIQELQATLANIESARPFEELTVDDVATAHPQLEKTVENMVSKGKWSVPGYTEKFGNLSMM